MSDECQEPPQCPKSESKESTSELVNQKIASTETSSSLITKCSNSDIFVKIRRPPNIQHELNSAKAVLQQCSGISGENLFDHLSSIIKKVLIQKPESVVDYFEEYSRDVREQKFNVIENFSECYFVEPTLFEAAEDILSSLKLPPQNNELDCEEGGEVECKVKVAPTINLVERLLIWNESPLISQFYWSLCGFGFQFDEVFQLSWVLQKLQFHPTVEHCRFWGKIYGLKNNYLIAEVTFTQIEIEQRNEKYKTELEFKSLRDPNPSEPIIKPELIPGTNWQQCPQWELAKMQPEAAPIPLPILEEEFNIPPEPYGSGVNQKSYFVISSLTDEWIELPLLTTEQINVARKIRKYFTGNLDATLHCYPRFLGCEKHFLRATIARISCGTFIAPIGFYKKQARGGDEEEEEEEEDMDEGGVNINNDVVLVKNEKYKPIQAPDIESLANWVHVRPNILDKQGRVNFFDQKKAIKELLKKRKLERPPEEINMEEEDEEMEEEEGEEEESVEIEIGPSIFSSCREDDTKLFIPAWTTRFSAVHNIMNQVMIVRSNLWPGSYNFASEQMADSIYLGWGHKYVTRNFSPTHIPTVQQEYNNKMMIQEILDPLPNVFSKYRQDKVFDPVIPVVKPKSRKSTRSNRSAKTESDGETEDSVESIIELGV